MGFNAFCQSVASYLTFAIDNYQFFVNSLLLANRNIVTPALLGHSDLTDVITHAKDTFGFTPLFEGNIVQYYTVLRAKVISDKVYVFVPFAASFNLQLINIIPFPTLVNSSLSLVLDLPESKSDVFVLLTNKFDSIAVTNKVYFEESCLSISSSNYLCRANRLVFYPTTKYPCLLDVSVQKDVTNSCKFKKFNSSTLVVKHISHFNYFYTANNIALTLSCGTEKPKLLHLSGNFKTPEACGVYSPDLLQIFPSHSKTLTVDDAVPRFQHVTLRKYVIPEHHRSLDFELMTTPPPLEKGPAYSDLPDFMFQAHPYVSYVGMPLLILVVVVGACVCARIFYLRKFRATFLRVRELATFVHKSAEPEPHQQSGSAQSDV